MIIGYQACGRKFVPVEMLTPDQFITNGLALELMARLSEAARDQVQAELALRELQDRCKHEVIIDRPLGIYDNRECCVCQKDLGLI